MKRREFIKTTGAAIAVTCTCGLSASSCSTFMGVSSMPAVPADAYSATRKTVTLDLLKIPDLNISGNAVKFEVMASYPREFFTYTFLNIHPNNTLDSRRSSVCPSPLDPRKSNLM